MLVYMLRGQGVRAVQVSWEKHPWIFYFYKKGAAVQLRSVA
jgi:hypothetical protein